MTQLRERFLDSVAWRCLGFIAICKVVYIGVLAAILYAAPELDTWQFSNNMARWPEQGEATFSTHWSTWDAPHYLKLAREGYQTGQPRCAFYPLWPGLLALALKASPDWPVTAAMLLANAVSTAGAWLFFLFVRRQAGIATAKWALVCLLLYPGSLFFQFPYSEGLFLVGLMGLLLAVEEESVWLAALCASLLPLSRASGQFVVLPLLWMAWRRRNSTTLVALAGLVLGVIAYYGLMEMLTGNALEGVQSQHFWRQNRGLSGKLWLRPLESLAVLPIVTDWHGYTGSLLDRLLFLGCCLTAAILWRRDREQFVWVLALGILPALFNSFVSMSRFGSLMWPCWLLLGRWASANHGTRRVSAIFGAMAVGHWWLVWNHVNFRWAG